MYLVETMHWIETMHWTEIILVSILVATPVYTAMTHEKNKQAIIDGVVTKIAAYHQTIIFLFIPTSLLCLTIYLTPLTWQDLGLTFNSSRQELISAGLLLLLTVLGTVILIELRANQPGLEKIRTAFESLLWILPTKRKEWRWFVAGVSPAAGICEELIYRGYLFWLFEPVVGTLWAITIASLMFGLGHIYQGWGGVLKTALLGAFFAAVYWYSGSLWPAIILHFLVDVYAGTQAYFAFRVTPEATGQQVEKLEHESSQS